MPIFMKAGDIKGEATDQDHKEWIIVESVSDGISRTIPEGAKDQERTKGHTLLGDVHISRKLDKSSSKLFQACANGTFVKEVEIHLCTTVKNKQEPYLKYKLENAILSSYQIGGSEGNHPVESVSVNYTGIEMTYVIVDPETGDTKGNVPGKYSPGKGAS